MKQRHAVVGMLLGVLATPAAQALLPPPDIECCQRKDYSSEQCARFKLSEMACMAAQVKWNETYNRWHAIQNSKGKSPASTTPEEKSFRGRFFELRYPVGFVARPLGAASEKEADAATFTAPDQSVEFYVYSPQWAGNAPGIALDPKSEIEMESRTGKGKSSGVAGSFRWTTIAAKDQSYTRSYQRFDADDGSICWTIGLRYVSAEALKRHQEAYSKFKASLVQLAD